MIEIAGMVDESLGPLCKEHALHLSALDPWDILLIGQEFAIRVFVEPYEPIPFFQYIDISDAGRPSMQHYAIARFFIDKRPLPPRHTRESFAKLSDNQAIQSSIDRFSELLATNGQDILREEKEWLKDWFQPPRPVEQRVVDAINQDRLGGEKFD